MPLGSLSLEHFVGLFLFQDIYTPHIYFDPTAIFSQNQSDGRNRSNKKLAHFGFATMAKQPSVNNEEGRLGLETLKESS